MDERTGVAAAAASARCRWIAMLKTMAAEKKKLALSNAKHEFAPIHCTSARNRRDETRDRAETEENSRRMERSLKTSRKDKGVVDVFIRGSGHHTSRNGTCLTEMRIW
jgi:hypothetical protein